MIPPTPKELDQAGRRIWRGLTRDLAAIGLLAKLDQHALARYIQLWQRWQQLQTFIEANGETYDVKRHFRVRGYYDAETDTYVPDHLEEYVTHQEIRPQTRLWMALADRLVRLEEHFGMTPSGRAAIGILLAGAEHYADTKEPPNPKRFLNLG
jgi:P27 family predicted phage terminase small subunit